jgi:hypothetical protein
MEINLKEGQILKHKPSSRYIKVLAINNFKNLETNEEELFCMYYWCGFGLVGTDLLENIERDYEIYENI